MTRPPFGIRWACLVGLVALLSPSAGAQSEGVLEVEGDLQRFVLRQHALGRLPELDPGALPLATGRALALLDSLALRIDAASLSRTDAALLAAYRGERVGGVLGPRAARSTGAFSDGRSLVRVAGDGYALELAPLLDAAVGPAFTTRVDTLEPGGAAWTLSRGLRVGGHVGRFYVESRISENQTLVPLGTRTRLTSPRRAHTVTTGTVDPTYDFMTSTGVVGYRGPLFEARAGRDRNRLGFARGSLILSNYASEYDHVQLRWTLGRVSFQSIAARFLDPVATGGDRLTEARYGAFHRLAVRPGRGVEVEVFESVIAGGRDAEGQRRGFEPAYLVPFQLYRAVERDLGSPDNVLLGGGVAWRITPGLRVYGQGLLDELTAARFFEDAWTNKWGYVAGFQIVDPRIPGLGRIENVDLQVEYTRIRPYVYSHRDSSTAAVHYGDVLGHPAGPNASDLNVRLAYRPNPDVELSADLSHTIRGRNTATENFGSDPYAPYGDRVPEPNPTLQGVRQRLGFADVRASVRLVPQVMSGLSLAVRTVSDAERGRSSTVVPQVFLRWSVAEPSPRY